MAIKSAMLLFQVCSGATAPATSSSKDMYAFWCAKEPDSLVCQHHNLIQDMIKTKDPTAKKEIQSKIQALGKTAKEQGGSLHSKLTEQYGTMKLAFCATNPKGAKALCSTAASQYKTGGASSRPWRRMRSASGGVTRPTDSSATVSAWYCAKPGVSEEAYCKRAEIMKKLRTPGMQAEERKELMTKLREVPLVYASSQAIYADYCKVEEHSATSTCTRLKHTQATRGMREWYCAQSTSTDSPWCKRQAVLDKMQKLPTTPTDPAHVAEKKKLSEEFSAFSKRPEGGGPSLSSTIAKEISAAKKSYCALEQNKEVAFCKASAGMLSTLGGRARSGSILSRGRSSLGRGSSFGRSSSFGKKPAVDTGAP